jgi:hypothetical protein
MTARELAKTELDTFPDETVKNVLFENDSVYLSAIPGMADSIKKGIETPLSECKNLSEVWPDYAYAASGQRYRKAGTGKIEIKNSGFIALTQK